MRGSGCWYFVSAGFFQRWQNILGCDVRYREFFEYLYVMDFSVHVFHGVSVWLFDGMIIAVFVCELYTFHCASYVISHLYNVFTALFTSV